MSEQYLIEKETLTAAADSVRLYVDSIPGTAIFQFDPNLFIDEDTLDMSQITSYYYEEYDSLDTPVLGTSRGAQTFITWGYSANDKGFTVPVLYTDTGLGDEDAFYYVGIERIGDAVYDKWQKIEFHDSDAYDQDTSYASWDGEYRNFIYTNKVVQSFGSWPWYFSPLEFPEKIANVYEAGRAASGGVDLSLASATAKAIRSGYTAYTADGLVSGELQNYNGATTVTPRSGSITLPTSGKFCPSNITVTGDTDLKAENIKKGVDIFGITGTGAATEGAKHLTLGGLDEGQFDLTTIGDIKAWYLTFSQGQGYVKITCVDSSSKVLLQTNYFHLTTPPHFACIGTHLLRYIPNYTTGQAMSHTLNSAVSSIRIKCDSSSSHSVSATLYYVV